MGKKNLTVDLFKLIFFLLKYCWIIILCAAIGFGIEYTRASKDTLETYTAYGTMYISNGNPNVYNYGYASSSDLTSAVMLLDTYIVVIRSNKVMDVVAERLSQDYPDITTSYIASTLSLGPVGETGVVSVLCTTTDPLLSTDICNIVMDVAPSEIIRVVNAGSIEIIDKATVPTAPDRKSPMKKAAMGGLIGAGGAGGVLTLLFLLYTKVRDTKELETHYTIPVLATIRRDKKKNENPKEFLLNENSRMDQMEMYAKLRMNMMSALAGKEKHSVLITSALSGEGKSTIAANLAISVAISGRRVLLVDADLRRACQSAIFDYEERTPGLADVLLGNCSRKSVLFKTSISNLDVLPAGTLAPNPTELLDSSAMRTLMPKLEKAYDLVLIDAPPVNIVSDAFELSPSVAGGIFVVRQRYSDHREIRKSLIQAEMSGLNLLGFAFYGEKTETDSNSRYYKNYYSKYDTRKTMSKKTKVDRKRTPDKEIVP